MLRVIVGLMYDVYDTYRLWWFPPDIFRFAWKLGDAMVPCIGSLRIVHEVLELVGFIEAMNFKLVYSSWRDRSNRSTDYHVGRTVPDGNWVYYNPFERQNVSCLLYTSPSPRDLSTSRMPSSA